MKKVKKQGRRIWSKWEIKKGKQTRREMNTKENKELRDEQLQTWIKHEGSKKRNNGKNEIRKEDIINKTRKTKRKKQEGKEINVKRNETRKGKWRKERNVRKNEVSNIKYIWEKEIWNGRRENAVRKTTKKGKWGNETRDRERNLKKNHVTEAGKAMRREGGACRCGTLAAAQASSAVVQLPVIMIVLQEACLFDYRPRAALLSGPSPW
jgi:hypothetical protein